MAKRATKKQNLISPKDYHKLPTYPEHFITPEDFKAIANQRVNDTDLRVQKQDGYILWLMGSGDNNKRKKYIQGKIAENYPHLKSRIRFIDMPKQAPLMTLKKKTKSTYEVVPDYEDIIKNYTDGYLYNATCIVINDFAVLACLLHSTTGHGNKKTLSSFRGSVYTNSLFSGIPALVINDASKCYIPDFQQQAGKYESNKAQNIQYFDYDLHKLNQIYENPTICRNDFDSNFEIVYGDYATESNSFVIAQSNQGFPVSIWDNLGQFKAWLPKQKLLALDFETSLGFISCISVTGLDHDNKLYTYVVPHISPLRPDNQHMTWVCFLRCLRWILQCNTPKIWHNGNYDLHYALKYNLPPLGINHDTMLMWHSIRAQMPQSLASVASIFSPTYYYWKDEIKGGSDEKKSNTKYAIPTTRNGIITYWRYAGLDTYHTMNAFIAMMPIITNDPRYLLNYAKEYALCRGPLLDMSYKGVCVDRPRLNDLVQENRTAASEALENLRVASNGIVMEDTNAECVEWLYHTLLASPPPKKADKKTSLSVDAKQLKLVSEQHPIYEQAIEFIAKHREPQKRVDMYGKPSLIRRNHDGEYSFHYNYGLRPYTGRLNSQGSAFWDGTNAQNITASMRSFICADKGKVLIDIDYSQADLYHFAVACGDENMMRNVFDDRDTHAVHVETILKVPYEEVMAKKNSKDKAENAFVNHPITGVRQIIKKLSHGGNYGMQPATAYLNAGRESLKAAAIQIGEDPSMYQRNDYYALCDRLLIPYHGAYPRQKIWRKELVQECVENKGYMTCFGGLTVYFDEWNRPREHNNLMRALLAFFGQGGTSGMINEAMLRLYYDDYFMRYNQIELLMQTHDSLMFQVPIDVLINNDIVNNILTIMELQCNFNGVDYIVPCEVNIGHRYSKGMPEVKRDDDATSITRKLLANYRDEKLI